MGVQLAANASWCVACWQQQVDARHVEWNVAFDGGVRQNENGYPVSTVDDLVLCENCVRAAVELLELDPQAMADLERENARLKAELSQTARYADGLEDLIPRRPGRPRRMAA